jgi:hypothetical protein
LIIALIMLVALAMLSLWSFNAGTMTLRVVGNSQARQEVVSAAQAATELTLSTPLFTQDPLAVAGRRDPDRHRRRRAARLPGPADPGTDLLPGPRPEGQRARSLVGGRSAPASARAWRRTRGSRWWRRPRPPATRLCADSEWNVRAVVSDSRSRATAAVNQGVAVRALTTDTASACP